MRHRGFVRTVKTRLRRLGLCLVVRAGHDDRGLVPPTRLPAGSALPGYSDLPRLPWA